MNLYILIIFFTLIQINSSSYEKHTSKFKLIKGTKSHPQVIDIEKEEDLEYPGKNPRILDKIKEQWSKYYHCLIEKADEIIKPEIVRLIEGLNTELKCDACIKPFQDFSEFEWKYKPISPDSNITKPEHLDLTPEMELTSNQTLKIFNVVESLKGLYVCYHGKNIVSIYILEIVRNDTIEQVSNWTTASEIIPLQDVKLDIYYKWSEWTDCDSCGNVGKKFHYGFCFVSTKEMTANWATKLNARDTAEPLFSYDNVQKNSDQMKNVKNPYNIFVKEDKMESQKKNYCMSGACDILDKFKTGVPCTSPYVPASILKFLFRYKAVRTVVEYCLVPCDEYELFEVIDKYGNIVEIANNSAGIYSVFQDIPKLPPEIERKSITAEYGTDIIIQCPGTLYKNIPVTWKTNKKIIFPEVIAEESNQRFTIDLINRINIKKLKIKDSRIYSCWNRNKLLGTVHLNVEKKFKIGFDLHITLLGILAIVGTFVYVGSKILTRELRSRKKEKLTST